MLMELLALRGAPRTEFETVTGTYEVTYDGPMVTVDASEGHITVVFNERIHSRCFSIQ